jgi:multicomponent Na+:H+ antiporter subunit E
LNPARQSPKRAAVVRFVFLLGLWCVLDGVTRAGLALGALSAGLGAWASLRIWPASGTRLRIVPLLSLVVYFLRSSVVAGFDVAWRAFQPRMRLRPGFVALDCRTAPGCARDVLLAMVSLTPGSVVVADEGVRVTVHCLDTGQEVAAQFADNEARLRRAVEGGADA